MFLDIKKRSHRFTAEEVEMLPKLLLFLAIFAIVTGCAHPVQRTSATIQRTTTVQHRTVKIIDHPLFNEQRLELTREYCKLHYGTDTDRMAAQRMIVVHYTASPTLAKALEFFTPPLLSRDDIRSGGAVNVSAHFLVDKDGSIYRLAPEDRICRHVIGFNNVALGIENVGEDKNALTDAQLQADAALIADLAGRYPTIRYLIGHYEYQDRSLPHFKLNTELDPSYHPTIKIDPGQPFMSHLRELLKDRYHLVFER